LEVNLFRIYFEYDIYLENRLKNLTLAACAFHLFESVILYLEHVLGSNGLP